MRSLVVIIMILFLIPTIGYGIGAGTVKNDKTVVTLMSKAMSTMGGYLVLAFLAAQFINYFNQLRLGTILSVNVALFLESVGFIGLPLIQLTALNCTQFALLIFRGAFVFAPRG